MRKTKESSPLYQLAYVLILILSVVFICGIAYGAYMILQSYDEIKTFKNILDIKNPAIPYILLIIICIIGTRICYIGRINIRHKTDYNSLGVAKKFSSYDKLSASQKAIIDEQKFMDSERILDSNVLMKMTHKGSVKPEEDMKNLIGLDNIKEEMQKMAARMMYENKNNKRKELDVSMHMCFLGPPGTGKTTCARIMTGFLYKNKYIRNNKCVEVDGNFLRGTNGDTSLKVTKLINSSLGGVLFIDEAYALLNGQDGEEAIATIVKYMEDKRDQFILILAGYDNEMKLLINSNPGMFSRIKYYLWFGNYSREELDQIFIEMAKENNFKVDDYAIFKFEQKMQQEMLKKNYGNARTVRNILEKAIDQHALNLMNKQISKKDLRTIKEIDINFNDKESDFFNH